MHWDKIVKTGTEVRMKNEKGGFVTRVEDVLPNEKLTVFAPNKPEHRILAKKGETFLISCVTEQGLYIFEAQVTNLYDSNQIPLIELQVISNCRRLQRREAFRVSETITVNIRLIPEEPDQPGPWITTQTINISETGTLLKFNEQWEKDQNVELVLYIDNMGIEEVLPKIQGKVVRCSASENRYFQYFLGIQFGELPERAGDVLLKLSILSQRSRLIYRQIKRNGSHDDGS